MSYQVSEYQTVVFEMVRCSNCGLQYMLEKNYHSSRREHGNTFYCPNGHAQCFRDSDSEKLAKAQAEISKLSTQVQLERDQKAATQASLDRLKHRVSKGVCPCCKRTVRQLENHMKSKHPNYPS